MEFHNKKVRRGWSPERRAADRLRRARDRVKFERYTPDPKRPGDTTAFVIEERALVEYFRSTRQTWLKLWPTLNELVGRGHVAVTRPRRQLLLALVQRLLNEKKLVRHRPTNSIALAPSLR